MVIPALVVCLPKLRRTECIPFYAAAPPRKNGKSLDFLDPEDRVDAKPIQLSRTIEVRALVPNGDHRLKPNMFARAELALGDSGEAAATGVVVPDEALAEIDGKTVVFVQEAERTFAVRAVVLGERKGGRMGGREREEQRGRREHAHSASIRVVSQGFRG